MIQNREVLISTTLFLVFFTTIVFGAFMPFVVKYYAGQNENDLSINRKSVENEISLETYEFQRYDKLNFKRAEDSNASFISKKITGIWGRVDNIVLKPFFIEDWPRVKEDHDQISNKIIDVFNEYQKTKIKNKELTNVSSDFNGKEHVVSLLDNTISKKRNSLEKNINKNGLNFIQN